MSFVELTVMPLKIFSFAPGLGLLTMLHWLPSQCSTSVCLGLACCSAESPIAHTSFVALLAKLFGALFEPTGAVEVLPHAVKAIDNTRVQKILHTVSKRFICSS